MTCPRCGTQMPKSFYCINCRYVPPRPRLHNLARILCFIKYSRIIGYLDRQRYIQSILWHLQCKLIPCCGAEGRCIRYCQCATVHHHNHKCRGISEGLIYGTAGEGPIQMCWPCARKALDYELGHRSWISNNIYPYNH